MRRGMTIAASAVLTACSGTGFADLGLDPAATDAGLDGAVADASAALASHDAGSDAAAPSIGTTPTSTPQSTCVPRDVTIDGGLVAGCHGSAECPTAMICCAHDGDDTGVCTAETSCSAAMPRQLCSANCECVHGTCANAWPYIVYAQCR